MTLAEKIRAAHNPALAALDGMVYQIWNDGEVTLQKSGALLWRRNLHTIREGTGHRIPAETMPCQINGYGFAFISDDDYEDLHDAFKD